VKSGHHNNLFPIVPIEDILQKLQGPSRGLNEGPLFVFMPTTWEAFDFVIHGHGATEHIIMLQYLFCKSIMLESN
jgi:hypothetical protein